MDATPTPDVTPSVAAPVAAAAPVATAAPTPAPAPSVAPVSTPAPSVTPTTGAPSAPSAGTASSTAPSAPASSAPTAADVEAAIAMFEALQGDEKVPLRADLKIPVGKDGKLYTLEQLTRSPLLEADYTRKTQRVAEERRTMERERVEMQARAELLKSNRERLMSARRQGGEALEREIRHQELLETDEDYRQRFEESEEFRVQQAVAEHEGATRTTEEAHYTAQNIRSYIGEVCAKHPELDPREIEDAYRAALESGKAELRSSSVDRIVASQLQRVQRVTQPLATQLDALKAELAALRAEQTVGKGNAAVSAQIGKTKAGPVGRPAAGAVPVTPGIQPFRPGIDNEQEYLARWKKGA